MPERTQSPRATLSWQRKLALAGLPVALLLAAGEFAARRFRERAGYPPVGGHSYRDQRIDLLRRGFPSAHDPVLGYVPRSGYAGTDNLWHTTVSIDERSLRRNGPGPRPEGPGVLAVGDSFTFGDQCSDQDTWPASLERRLQRPVWNGGVFGYSFGQTVLRAEALLSVVPCTQVVCSLIPDDLKRCELQRRHTDMPWFVIADHQLVLCGVPVPDSSHDNPLDQQWLRRACGYSALLDMLFWNAAPSWWVGQPREIPIEPPVDGLQIGKLLVERLAQRCRTAGAALLLVLQGDQPEMPAGKPVRATELLAHAQSLGVATLDLASRFEARNRQDPALHGRFFAGHMTPAGNQWVAEQIAAALTTTTGR